MLPKPLFISARQAALAAKKARRLHREGALSHAQYALIDTLLWSCRHPGRSLCRVSYTALQRLAHVSRQTIADAIPVLERLGLLRRFKQRLSVPWAFGKASRQDKNIYEIIIPATESTDRPVYSVKESFISANEERGPVVDNNRPPSDLEKALALIASTRAARLGLSG